METFGKYSGAPSELWDLTREFTTFWLSEASLQQTAMLFMCFYGAIRQTNMTTDSFNIYLSPVGVKSLNRFVINWQAGAKLIRHVHEYNGFVTLNASTIKNVMTCLKGTRGYICGCSSQNDLLSHQLLSVFQHIFPINLYLYPNTNTPWWFISHHLCVSIFTTLENILKTHTIIGKSTTHSNIVK